MRMGETNTHGSETLNSRIGRARQLDIREVAVILFAERGYHGTTMKDIGRLMGIRAPSLYHHVDSKQEILCDIMLGTEREVRTEFHQAIDGVEDVVESLRRAMEAYVLHHAHNRGEALIGNREVASLKEPAQSQLLQMRREHERAIRALIEKGCAENRLTVDHPLLASFGMLEMAVGVARWFHHDGPLPAEEVARSYGELAIRMCGANPT